MSSAHGSGSLRARSLTPGRLIEWSHCYWVFTPVFSCFDKSHLRRKKGPIIGLKLLWMEHRTGFCPQKGFDELLWFTQGGRSPFWACKPQHRAGVKYHLRRTMEAARSIVWMHVHPRPLFVHWACVWRWRASRPLTALCVCCFSLDSVESPLKWC